MKRLKFIIVNILIINVFFYSYSQSESKTVKHNGNDFNVFTISAGGVSSEFALLQNTNQIPHNQIIDNFKELYDSLDFDNAFFMTNASIVDPNCMPVGLLIYNYNTIQSINNNNGSGNFFLKPNGLLLFKHKEIVVCQSSDFQKHSNIKNGVQSGPMLITEGSINENFNPNSKNLNIRSGVGIYTDKTNQNHAVFAISENQVSFYEFSKFFEEEFNCKNALCLESAGSLMTIPYLQSSSDGRNDVVCNYIYFKPMYGEASGTGFAISEDGYIVTNHHVVDGAKTINIKGINGDFDESLKAKIKLVDSKNDLAILKIDDPKFSNIPIPPYTISQNISDVGTSAFAMGYPLRSTMGDEIKLTNGIISAKTGFQGDISTYQISVPIQPGNSGGPLFNEKGTIIGITSSGHTGAQNANYAIKTNYLFNLLGLLDKQPELPTTNTVSNKSLPEQVKDLKKFIYIIETSF
tara:strand:- start:3058 stop:4449 length:1392 start_codon:yes stop_codon:yes gene_type:complete